VNLLHQSVTDLYPSGTQAHFPVFRNLLSYFSRQYIPEPSTKDRNEYNQPAQGCNSSSVKADETCKHSICMKRKGVVHPYLISFKLSTAAE